MPPGSGNMSICLETSFAQKYCLLESMDIGKDTSRQSIVAW